MTLTFQYFAGGRWRGDSVTWRLNDKSVIQVFTTYQTRDIVGVPHRLRVSFTGDGSHAAATSAWISWKVTS